MARLASDLVGLIELQEIAATFGYFVKHHIK